MNCREVVRQLSEYLDGELDAGLVQALEEHLSGCRDCRIIVDTTRKTVEIFCNSEPLPLPDAVHERLMKALAAKFSGRH
ncbi:MAG: zf-HC2 domain-containing protein [Acidobacteria bacterium]|nr:zf-HC2 domain-containing protein [Acidobacteriota bacterium]